MAGPLPAVEASAALLPAGLATLTATAETAIAWCPPLDVLRMRLYVAVCSLAMLWMLANLMEKILGALWGVVAHRLGWQSSRIALAGGPTMDTGFRG